MALTLCDLVERWIWSKPKLETFKIIPVVRLQDEPVMGDILLWLPDSQRFPVGYIDTEYVEIFVPKPDKRHNWVIPRYERTGGFFIWPEETATWKKLYASSPNFFKDLEEHLLLIASRWK